MGMGLTHHGMRPVGIAGVKLSCPYEVAAACSSCTQETRDEAASSGACASVLVPLFCAGVRSAAVVGDRWIVHGGRRPGKFNVTAQTYVYCFLTNRCG